MFYFRTNLIWNPNTFLCQHQLTRPQEMTLKWSQTIPHPRVRFHFLRMFLIEQIAFSNSSAGSLESTKDVTSSGFSATGSGCQSTLFSQLVSCYFIFPWRNLWFDPQIFRDPNPLLAQCLSPIPMTMTCSSQHQSLTKYLPTLKSSMKF